MTITLILKRAIQALFRELAQNSVLHDCGARIKVIKLTQRRRRRKGKGGK